MFYSKIRINPNIHNTIMFMIVPVDNLDKNAIQYGEKVNNIIIRDSLFVKLFYSTPDVALNGIFIGTYFTNIRTKIQQEDTKIYFERDSNYQNTVDKLDEIEKNILFQYSEKYNSIQKQTPQLRLKQQFERQYLKIPYNVETTHLRLLIKISGIWITSTEYGITFKFIPIKELTLN